MNELVAGLAAGTMHVWLGADHLAAIAPLAAGRGRHSWELGVQWGAGHCVGAAAIVFGVAALHNLASTEWISAWGEITAGVLLVGMSLWHLRAGFLLHHGLQPAGKGETLRRQDSGYAPGTTRMLRATRGAKPVAFGFGVVHGVAGGSTLAAVLLALTFTGLLQPLAFFGGFAAGSMAAMATFSLLMDRLGQFSRLARHVERGLTFALAGASGAVGVFWLVRGGH